MTDKYILDGHTPVPATLTKWEKWFRSSDRKVARTEGDGWSVSTVFLGLDHGFGEGPPLLFETMIFGGPLDQEYQTRASTWEEAEAQHAEAVAAASGGAPSP